MIGGTKSKLFQNLLKNSEIVSALHARPKRSMFFSYCPVYLGTMICNQWKFISHKANWMGYQFQDKKRVKTCRLRYNLNLKSKIINCNFHPCPSDTIKHFLESSKPSNPRLTSNVIIMQLNKFIWWIFNLVLSWPCIIFYLTQKYWFSVRQFFFDFVTVSVAKKVLVSILELIVKSPLLPLRKIP